MSEPDVVTEDVTVRPRPRNGAEPTPFHREPSDPAPDGLAAWSRGASALATMPARLVLDLTEGIEETRARARAELGRQGGHLERLRYWPEDAIGSDLGERAGARVLTSIPDGPPPPLFLDRLDPLGHTILYGTGGAGKGTLASEWIRRLADEGARVLIVDYENHPDEWARRLSGLGAGVLTDRVLHVAPFAPGWQLSRGPIWAQAPDLYELARAWGATYIVVDSIVPACGAIDPLKPEAAGQYAAALERIGLPVLSLAHVTKAEQVAYPFGSVFWHNLARLTWSLQVDGKRAVLVNRKANNYSRGGRYVVESTWQDGRPVEVWERAYSAVLADRIADALGEGRRTVEQLVAALNEGLAEDEVAVKPDSVRAALRRGLKGEDRRFDLADGKYSLAGAAPEEAERVA